MGVAGGGLGRAAAGVPLEMLLGRGGVRVGTMMTNDTEQGAHEFYKELGNGQYPWEHLFAADCVERVLSIIKRQWPHLAPSVETAVEAARRQAVVDSKAAVMGLAAAMAAVDRATRRSVVGGGGGARASPGQRPGRFAGR